MSHVIEKILDSWNKRDGCLCSADDVSAWIMQLNEKTRVNIEETPLSQGSFWFYDADKGEVLNTKKSFFSVKGLRYFIDDVFVAEQPVIFQDEIGFLGIIVKEFDGVLHFLMQGKIEPGNVNGVQISPTIQATRSNFTRIHGGQMPPYFDWFKNPHEHGVILYDQIQSEQGNRFAGKRNRNVILLTQDDIPVYPNYKWLTLGQIKNLMKIDNLVNMDTRTVLSGVLNVMKYADGDDFQKFFRDKAFFKSVFSKNETLVRKAFGMLNDYKMYKNVSKTFVGLNQLKDWAVDDFGITCAKSADFDVRYYRVEIAGREVQSWFQPLFRAKSQALFVLITRVVDGVRQFLISLKPEIGCFDKVEFGPSIQIANIADYAQNDTLYHFFKEREKTKKGFLTDVVLSEEGGRFYHEQNRNVIVEVGENDLDDLDSAFLWADYATLNFLLSNNNLLNIQLRNLLSLLEI